MHFAFLTIGLAMPYVHHIFCHGLIFANILVSNLFLHYDHLDMMITLALPVYVGVCLLQFILENAYADQYLAKKSLEKNSICDELTGVNNRYKIAELIDPDTNAFFMDEGIIMTIMDIDFFKKVNDTFGHEAGDIILKNVADRLTANINVDDYVIRWGGEEFVLILVGYEIDKATELIEEIRKDIEKYDNGICPLTVSFGVSKYKAGEDYHECIKRADKALYYAKKHGRNQVINYAEI